MLSSPGAWVQQDPYLYDQIVRVIGSAAKAFLDLFGDLQRIDHLIGEGCSLDAEGAVDDLQG